MVSETPLHRDHLLAIAKQVKKQCAQAAQEQFRHAAMSGLCMEGAIEAALGAIQSIDEAKIAEQFSKR